MSLAVPEERLSIPVVVEEPVAAGLPGTDIDSVLALTADLDSSNATLQAPRSSITDYWRRDDEPAAKSYALP